MERVVCGYELSGIAWYSFGIEANVCLPDDIGLFVSSVTGNWHDAVGSRLYQPV